LPFQLREKLAPEVEGKSGRTSAEDAYKVILESLDGLFSHVATMVIGGNKFECHARCANGFLVRRRFLIVQYLIFMNNACFLHAFQGLCLRKNKFAAGVIFEGLHP
jgi:hypothetical protein